MNNKLNRAIIGFLAFALSAATAKAQMVSCNVFLQGKYEEIGINSNGAFGSSVAAPAGYHPRNDGSDPVSACSGSNGSNNLGFVADPAKDGWTVGNPAYFGDYFLPGSPQEGWSVEVNGVQSNAWNGNSTQFTGSLTGSNYSYTSVGSKRIGTWKGHTTDLTITQVTTQDTANLFFTVNVTLTNSSAVTKSNVYYLRTVDPDNDETLGGSFATNNTIVDKLPNSLNATLVSATGQTYSAAYLGLGTLDCRAKCFIIKTSLEPTVDLASCYANSTSNVYTGTFNGDVGIGLVFNIGSIPAGDSVSFAYAYVLNASYLTSAFQATAPLWSATGDTTVALHVSHDTAKICQNSNSTITIANPGTYTWSWTALTGETLSTSTGTATSVSTGTTVISLRAVGTGSCSGVNDTLFVNLNPTSTIPITGVTTICAGFTTHLSDAFPGGTWSSSNPSVASVVSNTGVVTAGSPGTTVITYNIPRGCSPASVVTVNSAPTISCTGNVNKNADAGVCSAHVTYSAATTTGTSPTITYSQNSGTSFPVGVTTVTATATNTCGTANCNFTVTVTDKQPPVINVSNVSVNNDAGTCGAAVSLSATATDNCGVTATPTNDWAGGSFPVGITTVNWSVTDINGNTGTAQQTVTVTDNQAPVISVSNVSVNNDAGTCGAAVSLSATATDNCGVTATPTNDWAGGPFPVGITTVNWSVTDINGNTGTAQQTITVTDNQAPVISVSNVSVNNDAGTCGAAVSLSATATDNCGVTATPTNDWAGGPFPVGITTVNWSVTDINGNTGTAQQTVTVTDNQAPVISVSNVAVNNDAGTCGAAVSLSATATDNCGVTATPTNDWAGGPFPVGITTVNWSVTDINGNTGTAQQTVTVTDNQAPVISVSNVSVNNDAGTCGAAVSLSATASDNCGVTTTPTNDWAGGPFPVGITTVNWSVTDIHGNTGTAQQTITVTDNEKPVISVSNVSVNNDAGTCGAAVSLSATARDNCSVGTPTNDWTGGPFPVGTTTVNWSVTDIHGNTGTAQQTVTVTDNEKPVISVSNVSVNNDAGTCGAAVTLSATATDNCSVGTPTNDWTGGSFPVGTTTVNWTVTDIHGNTGTAQQTVTVTDNQKPVISVSNVSVNNDAGTCGAAVVLSATATDNCGVTATPTNDWAGGPFPVGTTTVNWSVTDIHGNTGTAQQTVTVTDNQKPLISVTNVSVNNDPGACSATVTLASPITSDNCGVLSVTNNHASTTYPVGTTIVCWTVRDIHGNSATINQTVVVTDNQKPTITAPSNVTINGWCRSVSLTDAGASLGTPTYADNCGILSVTNNAPSVFPVGTTTVTWTATDIHGNTATATQAVTVNQATLTLTATATNTSCNTANGGNHNNGSIATTVSGGTAAYTYAWSNSATCASPTGLAIGTYNVTVTDAHSCTTTGSATVGQPTALGVTVTAANTSCNTVNGGNHSNGSITTVTSGGTGADTYAWSNGATCANPPGLSIGTYSVTVTDAHSCTTTGSATVGQPTALGVTATATNTSCNTANGGNHSNGSITTVTSGGTGTDTYLWSNASTSANPTGLVIGTYNVTVTDGHSCTTTGSATVGQPAALTVTATASNIACNSANSGTHNNGGVTTVVAGGTGTDTYLWSNGQTSTAITGLVIGTYSVTITDAHSCTTTGSATVNQPVAITSTITGSSSVLGSTTSVYTGPSGLATYSWSISGGKHVCDAQCHHNALHHCGPGCDHYGQSCTSACHHNVNHVCTNNHIGDHHCNIFCHHYPGHVCAPGCDHYGQSCTSACHHNSQHHCNHEHCGSAIISGAANGQSVSVMNPCCPTTDTLTLTTTNTAGCSSTSTQIDTVVASATITVYSSLYTTGSGWFPTTTKTALAENLKVYNRNTVGRRDFNQSHYSSTWNSTTGLVPNAVISAPVTVNYGGGPTDAYTITVPAYGHYIIIGQASISSPACSGGTCTIYTGRKVGGYDPVDGNDDNYAYDDDVDDDLTTCSNSFVRFNQVMQDQTGKCTEADTHQEFGSLMLIVTPLSLTYTDTTAYLPIVYESVEGTWDVSVTADPPYGFYTVPAGALSTSVTDSVMNTVQFAVNDTGSDWTFTKLTHNIMHKGVARVAHSQPSMVNDRTNKPISLTIVPNPADDHIQIVLPKFEGKATVYIYNMLGQKVAEQKINVLDGGPVSMDISSFVPGVYTVTVQNGSGKATSRLVKNGNSK